MNFKLTVITIFVIILSGSYLGAQENDNFKFDGTWQVKLEYREKPVFNEDKNELIQEVQKRLEEGESPRYTNVRKSITINNYFITLMSQEEVDEGLQWPLVEYTQK